MVDGIGSLADGTGWMLFPPMVDELLPVEVGTGRLLPFVDRTGWLLPFVDGTDWLVGETDGLVEGAGGILPPMMDAFTNLDLEEDRMRGREVANVCTHIEATVVEAVAEGFARQPVPVATAVSPLLPELDCVVAVGWTVVTVGWTAA